MGIISFFKCRNPPTVLPTTSLRSHLCTHIIQQDVAAHMQVVAGTFFQHTLCPVSTFVLVWLWCFSTIIFLFSILPRKHKKDSSQGILLQFINAAEPEARSSRGVLPCNPLPGVKHLVCSKARATTAPLSVLAIEST